MSRRERSPVRLACDKIELGPGDFERVCEWTCDESRVTAVELVERGAPRFTAILHRNTKPTAKKYPWQLSFFTDGEPTGDSTHTSCKAALATAPHSVWRLKNVGGRTGRR